MQRPLGCENGNEVVTKYHAISMACQKWLCLAIQSKEEMMTCLMTEAILQI